jgi:DNA invertase Pin-like site-specific DNA recombinase
MQYISYIRTSTKTQHNGLDAQRNAIERYIDMSGGEVIKEYMEQESGSKDNRTELSKALAQCKKLKATLLVAKLDRVSRKVSFIATLMESNITLKVCDMPHADTFQLHIYAALAEQERQMISQRTKAALAVKKAQGVVLGRGDKVQVAKDARTFALTILPQIDAIRSSGVKSLRGIAKALNEKGIKARSGGVWESKQVRRILTNAAAT